MKTTYYKALFFFIFLSFTFNTFSQKYNNNWAIDKNCLINFSDCKPKVDTISNTNIECFEGVSTISDSLGNLLFYTNSGYVWNKKNEVMENGELVTNAYTPLGSTLSQVIIIPKPGSSNIYYIITTDVQGQRYSMLSSHTIDVSLNNGLGKVVKKNDTLSLLTISEQLSATYHQNKRDIWIMAHEYQSNTYLAYLVDSNGINKTPVISKVGNPQRICNSNQNALGDIKFSPNGKKMAFCAMGSNFDDSTTVLDLLDFDNLTGKLSNPINLPFSRGEYSLSFSPDNSKLYVGTWNNKLDENCSLYQLNINNPNIDSIQKSKYILDSSSGPYGKINIGPDGRVYIRFVLSGYLGVIEKPNNSGVNCQFNKNGLYIGNRKYGFNYGLTNTIEYEKYCSDTPIFVNSISEGKKERNVFLFPNKIKNNSVVNINSIVKEGNLILYNSLGQPIFNKPNIHGLTIEINCKNCKSGLYYYILELKNETFFGKLEIED